VYFVALKLINANTISPKAAHGTVFFYTRNLLKINNAFNLSSVRKHFVIIIISCHRFSFFPGTSALEPVVNPTTQASSLSL
jgi:hypothetical protein